MRNRIVRLEVVCLIASLTAAGPRAATCAEAGVADAPGASSPGVAATAPASTPASANFLKNGDFAAGQEGWHLTHTKDANWVRWDAAGGEGRARCFEAAVLKDLQKLQQDLPGPLAEGVLYELSADVKCDTDNTSVSLSTASGYGVTRGFSSGGSFPKGQWSRLAIHTMGRHDKSDGGRSYKVILDWNNKNIGDASAHIWITNVQLREVGRLDLAQDANQQPNRILNGDFEKGLEDWGGANKGGFEISDKGFDGNCAVLKAHKTDIHGADQLVAAPNEDALYRLSFQMKAQDTEGGKYFIGVMFIFTNTKGRPCGYYFLPLQSTEENVWLDKTCWFYADKLWPPIDPNAAEKQMKVKIAFYSNPAKQETSETYCFDNIRLVRMENALKK